MTENKAQKRDVRRRMRKTGERYTAARRNVLKPPPRVAEPGMSEAAVKRGTGKTWDEWFAILDAWGASRRRHPDIARHVAETYEISGWWAQGVTVGYERARGMRAPNEGPDGYSATVSKTFPVPLERLRRMFLDTRQRNRWLERGTLRARASRSTRAARFDIGDGTTRLSAWFVEKGHEKAGVQLQIERLADAAAVAAARAEWRERLARLGATLDG